MSGPRSTLPCLLRLLSIGLLALGLASAQALGRASPSPPGDGNALGATLGPLNPQLPPVAAAAPASLRSAPAAVPITSTTPAPSSAGLPGSVLGATQPSSAPSVVNSIAVNRGGAPVTANAVGTPSSGPVVAGAVSTPTGVTTLTPAGVTQLPAARLAPSTAAIAPAPVSAPAAKPVAPPSLRAAPAVIPISVSTPAAAAAPTPALSAAPAPATGLATVPTPALPPAAISKAAPSAVNSIAVNRGGVPVTADAVGTPGSGPVVAGAVSTPTGVTTLTPAGITQLPSFGRRLQQLKGAAETAVGGSRQLLRSGAMWGGREEWAGEGQPPPSRLAMAQLHQALAHEATALVASQGVHARSLTQLLPIPGSFNPGVAGAAAGASAATGAGVGAANANAFASVTTGARTLQIGGRTCTCAYVSQFFCQPTQQATGGPEGMFCCCG
ncbi:hypothetical protein V8C86DRAFT_3141296 [Haematococcus lacustris]